MSTFKNLIIFRITGGLPVTAAALSEHLAKNPTRPIGPTEPKVSGWVPPAQNLDLAHAVGGHWLLNLRTEEKIVPGSAVSKLARERSAKIEAEQGYKLGKRQAAEIKQMARDELMSNAITKESFTGVWIDPKAGWLGIDASSATKAEDVLAILRANIDPQPSFALVKTVTSPSAAMTNWLSSGEAGDNLTIDRDCVLRANDEEGGTVRYTKHSLDGDEVRKHIATGKHVIKLALTSEDRLSFILTDKLEIKRLALLDVANDNVAQGDTKEDAFDGDFLLMASELSRMLEVLVAALGGFITE